MKVDNVKPRGPFHFPRWSPCDRATRTIPLAKPKRCVEWSETLWGAHQSLVDVVVCTTKEAMTPVINLRQCGACWAFSITDSLDDAWVIATSDVSPSSEQQLVVR